MEPKEYVTINGQSIHFREGVRLLQESATSARARGSEEEGAQLLTIAANVLYDAGHPGEAIEQLRAAEVAWRETYDLDRIAECLGLKALWLHEAQESEAALEALREVEEIDRSLGSNKLEITLEQQFGILYDLGDVEGMKRVGEEFFRVAQDAEAIWRIRRRLMHFNIEEGEAGKEAATVHPYDFAQTFEDRIDQMDAEKSVQLKDLLAQASEQLTRQDFAEALVTATEATRIAGEVWSTWWLQGQALFGLGQYEDCVASLDQALALHDREPQVWWMKGHALSYLGRYEEEIACCDLALALKPDYVEALAMKAAALLTTGEYAKAVMCCDRAIGINEESKEAWMNKGAALLSLEQFSEAEACFQEAQRLGQPGAGEAIAHCRKMISSSVSRGPSIGKGEADEEALFRRGIELASNGREAEAIACIDQILEINPGHPHALSFKAASLRSEGRNDEAIACCDRALAVEPGTLRFVWRNKALALHALERMNEELAWYDEVLRGDIPDDERGAVWNLKGCALATIGRVAEAIPCFREAGRFGVDSAAETIARCQQFLNEE